jgi:indolepyruvate ferredoxin oxidoreductase alpha subunit
MRKKGVTLPTFEIIDQEEFEKSGLIREFACPAMAKAKKGCRINPELCWGCGVCAQICPQGIKATRERREKIIGKKL